MRSKTLFLTIMLMFTLVYQANAITSYDYEREYERASMLYQDCAKALGIRPILDIKNTRYHVEYDALKLFDLCRNYSAADLKAIGDICHMRIKNLDFPDASRMRTDTKRFATELAEATCDLEAIIILKMVSDIYDRVTVTF